jgi:hypothetical protein
MAINEVGRTSADAATLKVCRILVCRRHFGVMFASSDPFRIASRAPSTVAAEMYEIYMKASCHPHWSAQVEAIPEMARGTKSAVPEGH